MAQWRVATQKSERLQIALATGLTASLFEITNPTLQIRYFNRGKSGSSGRDTVSKVWLITGSSRGLGRAFTKAVLEAGDRVVAIARKPEQLADPQT
jgi:hypothetical protein